MDDGEPQTVYDGDWCAAYRTGDELTWYFKFTTATDEVFTRSDLQDILAELQDLERADEEH